MAEEWIISGRQPQKNENKQPISGAVDANLQVGNTDVTDNNPVPVKEISEAGKDFFEMPVFGTNYNQVEARLDASDWEDFTDETNLNGGDATQASGIVSVSSSTATNGSSILTTTDSIGYRPSFGIYGGATAIFTTGITGADQWVGITDDTSFTNGVQFGYKGTSFGIRYMRGGAEISFTAKADWDDPCDGVTASSQFKRDGVLEALDPTKDNVYRVLAGLFGGAGWKAQVFSPDKGWITVLHHKHANAFTVPVFQTNTFKVVVAVIKTSGATNIVIKSQCLAGGTSTAQKRLTSTVTDRTLVNDVRAVVTGKDFISGSYVNVSTFAPTAGENAILTVPVGATNGLGIEVLSDGVDNLANSTNQQVTAALLYVYDGTAWDRGRGDSTNGTLVNLGANNDVVDTAAEASLASIDTKMSSAATESTLTAINGKLPDFSGTWGYNAGTNGTVTLSGSKRVLQITATALEAQGTITINGGDTIIIPYGATDKVSSQITIAPIANLTDPTIIFSSGVDSYFIEHLS